MPSCRYNKAKVLKITNFAQDEEYTEAWSLVDENFVYRQGQWVTVDNFNEDSWCDSTTGIHFWMTQEEARTTNLIKANWNFILDYQLAFYV